MKKKIMMAVCVVVAMLAALTACGSSDYSDVLSANWDISLPEGAAMVYSSDSGSSFHGDGIRFHVYSYEDEAELDALYTWSSTEEETIFSASYTEAADAWLDEISVPEENRPTVGECVYWYSSQTDNSEIIMLKNSAEGRLYILESFL